MPSPDGGAERLGGLGESHHPIIELRCIIYAVPGSPSAACLTQDL